MGGPTLGVFKKWGWNVSNGFYLAQIDGLLWMRKWAFGSTKAGHFLSNTVTVSFEIRTPSTERVTLLVIQLVTTASWDNEEAANELCKWTCALLVIIRRYFCLDIISQRRLFHACNLPHYSVIKSQVCQLSFKCEYSDDIALRRVFLGNRGQRPQFYACAHESSAFMCTEMRYIVKLISCLCAYL
jgi:hypothetical protein